MNFQGYLENTYKLIKEEPLILIGGGFLLELLLLLSQGLLFLITGPLLGGYLLLIILALRENKKPAFNDIFSGLYQFRNLLPYTLVVLIIFIGLALFIIPGLIFATWWIYVLPLMIDRKISYSKAMGLSMNKVNETGFFMHLIFLLLITFIPLMFFNFIAATMPFLVVTSVLYPPFLAGCLACLYLDQFKKLAEGTTPKHEEKTAPKQKEEAAEAAPVTQPPAEETGDQVDEESSQSGQPVSKKPKTSDQRTTRTRFKYNSGF
jgi:hypothetical protein